MHFAVVNQAFLTIKLLKSTLFAELRLKFIMGLVQLRTMPFLWYIGVKRIEKYE